MNPKRDALDEEVVQLGHGTGELHPQSCSATAVRNDVPPGGAAYLVATA